jgi:hypothetical protein
MQDRNAAALGSLAFNPWPAKLTVQLLLLAGLDICHHL